MGFPAFLWVHPLFTYLDNGKNGIGNGLFDIFNRVFNNGYFPVSENLFSLEDFSSPFFCFISGKRQPLQTTDCIFA
jgi:hypothetical protein